MGAYPAMKPILTDDALDHLIIHLLGNQNCVFCSHVTHRNGVDFKQVI